MIHSIQAPIPYNFAYAVKDDYTYNDFGHQETSDGYAKTGSYYVLLPDGRMQTVNYKADENGYVADVSYKGEAQYPEYKPAYSKPAYPSYKPAYPEPAYPKPAYKPRYNQTVAAEQLAKEQQLVMPEIIL